MGGFPEASSLSFEFFSELLVPVFVVLVEFEIMLLGHVADGEDSLWVQSGHVLHCGDGCWHELFEMMHFVTVLGLTPESIWLGNEDEILIFVVSHFGNIIEVHLVDETHQSGDVHSVCWSDDRSLGTVLDVHVVVVITISDTFEVPAGIILELSWDIEPIPVVGHPRKRWSSISLIDFEDVETWAQTENDGGGSLPEFAPFSDSGVLVDDLSLGEVQSGIWLHWWGLKEWLELITWVSWSSLKTDNLLDWLFSEHWETESSSDVREFLIFGPLNVVLGTLFVPMIDSWPVLQSLLPSKLPTKKLSGGLSPSMVMLEEHVVQIEHIRETWCELVHVWWDIAHFLDDSWSHLGDMHIDEETVVSINFNKLVLAQIFGIDVILNITVLMWQNNIWVSIFVSWCLKIVDLKVFSSLSFIN